MPWWLLLQKSTFIILINRYSSKSTPFAINSLWSLAFISSPDETLFYNHIFSGSTLLSRNNIVTLTEAHFHLPFPSPVSGKLQRGHNAVVEEFGNSYFTGSLDIKLSKVVQNRENLQITTDAGTEVQEYPWATGYVGDIETTHQVRSDIRYWMSIKELWRIWFTWNTEGWKKHLMLTTVASTRIRLQNWDNEWPEINC